MASLIGGVYTSGDTSGYVYASTPDYVSGSYNDPIDSAIGGDSMFAPTLEPATVYHEPVDPTPEGGGVVDDLTGLFGFIPTLIDTGVDWATGGEGDVQDVLPVDWENIWTSPSYGDVATEVIPGDTDYDEEGFGELGGDVMEKLLVGLIPILIIVPMLTDMFSMRR